jgi:hypothetical protein
MLKLIRLEGTGGGRRKHRRAPCCTGRSESGFLAEIRRDSPGWFPELPHHSEVNRRARWLWRAFEQVRACLADLVPADDWGQVDTSALPVKHPSRVRGPDSWTGPNGLVARFGRDAAHGQWFYGFRLAARTDLGSRLVRAWAIVPAAVNERDLVPGLVEGAPRTGRAAGGQGVQRQGAHRIPCCSEASAFLSRPPGSSAGRCRQPCRR